MNSIAQAAIIQRVCVTAISCSSRTIQAKAAKDAEEKLEQARQASIQQRQMQETIWLRGELRNAFLPSNTELAALGSARATAVRDALLAKGDIDPARLFLVTGQSGSAKDGHVRLELKLK